MKLLGGLFYGALLVAGVSASHGKKLSPDRVEKDVSKHSLEKTLKKLNKIGDTHGGNRAFGLPGYKASVDYVLSQVKGRYRKQLNTYVQPFNHTFEQTRDIWVKGPDGEDVYVITLMYNSATPVPDGTTALLIDTPVDDERGSACFADQWEGIDATGKIALVKRGACAISDKLKLARAAGAKAVILYNNQPGEAIGGATLSAENLGQLVPVGVIPLEVGTAWKERLAKGEDLEVTLLVDSIADERETWNIISETKAGDPNNVVMLGAHLDSVQAGPGINDDGSGTAALLELVGSFTKYDGFKNKVRFAWWGAEESGLVGSLYYGKQLTPAEADKIRFYFNYDMIGSPHPEFVIEADTDAHKVGGKLLFDYLKKKGKPAEYGSFGSSSDYVAFLELGIPSSGLFTGADTTTDPCYHLKCDTLSNINWDAITVNTKAAGRAAAHFALSLDGVPPREQTSANPRRRRGTPKPFKNWSNIQRVVEKEHSCAASGKIVV
ncbi:Fc.00g107140.m01.CDS01 [Cosmosporella sp. VM-42]